jgi:hypothetical protein
MSAVSLGVKDPYCDSSALSVPNRIATLRKVSGTALIWTERLFDLLMRAAAAFPRLSEDCSQSAPPPLDEERSGLFRRGRKPPQWVSKRKRIAEGPAFVGDFLESGASNDIEALYELSKLADTDVDAAQGIIENHERAGRCSSTRVIAAFDVSAATISIRPLQRAHSRTSFRNTRQIRAAQGNRFGTFGAASSPVRGRCLGAAGSVTVDGTIPALAANAGAKTPK